MSSLRLVFVTMYFSTHSWHFFYLKLDSLASFSKSSFLSKTGTKLLNLGRYSRSFKTHELIAQHQITESFSHLKINHRCPHPKLPPQIQSHCFPQWLFIIWLLSASIHVPCSIPHPTFQCAIIKLDVHEFRDANVTYIIT